MQVELCLFLRQKQFGIRAINPLTNGFLGILSWMQYSLWFTGSVPSHEQEDFFIYVSLF